MLLLLLLLSCFSCVRLSATPWTAAHQAPLSVGFSRREYWSGVHHRLQDSMLLLQLEEASPEGKVYCFVITSIVK